MYRFDYLLIYSRVNLLAYYTAVQKYCESRGKTQKNECIVHTQTYYIYQWTKRIYETNFT